VSRPSQPEGPLYMGVDLESGEPGAPGARYSVAAVDAEGRLVGKWEGASLARLVRLAWELRPAAIGTDNPFELAPSQAGLARLLEVLPPGTRLVQVNVEGGRPLPLREAAARAGLDAGQGKPTPARTAYLAAVLAARGHGAPLRLVGERVVITVSRGRWSRSGGMSVDRYQRRIRASVRRAAEKVREALERAGLDFDVTYRESEGGLDSAVFTVYAPRERLVGIVRPHRGVDYTITVRVAHRGEVRLDTGEPSRPDRPLIVGLDPGQTTGLAVLDLHGRVILTLARRGFDRGSIVEVVESLGRPVVVAVDVEEPPEAVRKLAAQFNAELFHPDKPMSVAEKAALAARALGGRPPKTTHERDALAAAYKAYLALKAKLERLDSYLAHFHVDLDPQKVKEAVIRGVTAAEAVEREIERLLTPPQGGRGPPAASQAGQAAGRQAASREGGVEPERLHLLEARARRAEEEAKRLRAVVERLEAQLEEARLEARRCPRPDAALEAEARRHAERAARLEAEVEELRGRLERLARLAVRAGRGEVVAARILPALTSARLRESVEALGPLRGGEVVAVANPGHYDPEALDALAEAGVAAVLAGQPGWERLARDLREREIPLFPLSEYLVDVVSGVAFVDSSVLRDAEEWVERLREERAAQLDLERLVREYRMERLRGARRGGPRRGLSGR